MNNKSIKTFQIVFLLIFSLSSFFGAFAQNPKDDKELAQAMEFVKNGRPIDALPLLEKLSLRYPKDAEIQAELGISILVNSVTIKDETARRKDVARGGEVLKKAKQLGTQNVLALHYLDLVETGGDIDSVSHSASKEVEEAIREGEGFYGRGEFEKAFESYQKAYKLDPQSYDAALFAGDCFYAQKKYAEAEIWFAKAVAINPNREQAFRFWGDALALQDKGKESLPKYADAFIAEPNSRLTFNTLIQATRNHGNRRTSPFILLPIKEDSLGDEIDTDLLSNQEEVKIWNNFAEIRKKQSQGITITSSRKIFTSNLKEDVEALKSVATAAKTALQKDKTLQLSQSLLNLIKVDSIGMLDVYIMLFIQGENSPEYYDFREKNRDRMRKFLVDYFAENKL